MSSTPADGSSKTNETSKACFWMGNEFQLSCKILQAQIKSSWIWWLLYSINYAAEVLQGRFYPSIYAGSGGEQVCFSSQVQVRQVGSRPDGIMINIPSTFRKEGVLQTPGGVVRYLGTEKFKEPDLTPSPYGLSATGSLFPFQCSDVKQQISPVSPCCKWEPRWLKATVSDWDFLNPTACLTYTYQYSIWSRPRTWWSQILT